MAATAAEPSLWDAQHYVGTAVRKYFEADPESDFAGGWFQGRVGTAEAGLQDRATKKKYNGLLFLIRCAPVAGSARACLGGPVCAPGWCSGAPLRSPGSNPQPLSPSFPPDMMMVTRSM